MHKGTQEGKIKRNLALPEENSQSSREDDYWTLPSTDTPKRLSYQFLPV